MIFATKKTAVSTAAKQTKGLRGESIPQGTRQANDLLFNQSPLVVITHTTNLYNQ